MSTPMYIYLYIYIEHEWAQASDSPLQHPKTIRNRCSRECIVVRRYNVKNVVMLNTFSAMFGVVAVLVLNHNRLDLELCLQIRQPVLMCDTGIIFRSSSQSYIWVSACCHL